MVNKIVFDSNYPKLCNQARAKLVWIDLFLTCDFPEGSPENQHLLDYDTKRSDGSNKELRPEDYLLLFFVGDKGIMFSSLQRRTRINEKKFFRKIGQWFNVEVKNVNKRS